MVQCPECKRIIMDSTQSGGYKIRSRMILFSENKAVAICPTCKTYVEVPIILGALPQKISKEKIVVNK